MTDLDALLNDCGSIVIKEIVSKETSVRVREVLIERSIADLKLLIQDSSDYYIDFEKEFNPDEYCLIVRKKKYQQLVVQSEPEMIKQPAIVELMDDKLNAFINHHDKRFHKQDITQVHDTPEKVVLADQAM